MEYKNLAVAYIRMSTEHQEFSPDIQRRFIQKYAKEQGLILTREYLDEGRSGLSAEKRPQFLSLINFVQSGNADFSHILVYDISRWGRFLHIMNKFVQKWGLKCITVQNLLRETTLVLKFLKR